MQQWIGHAGPKRMGTSEFQSLFAVAPDAYLMLRADPGFTVAEANDAYLSTTSTSRDQLVGRPLAAVFPPAAREQGTRELQRSLEETVASRTPQTIPSRRYRLPGGEPFRYWRIRHIPVAGPGGEVDRVLQRIEDLTPLVRLEQTRRRIAVALAESETRYRLVVDSMPDHAVFLLDEAARIAHWNRGAERLLGYTETEILGQPAAILFTDEDRARGEPERELLAAKTTGSAACDRWHVRRDGTRFFVSGLMCALHSRRGRRIGFAKIMRDVTDRQAAAAERDRLLQGERVARAEAERTGRLKDEFLATLSHELRTPLNAILGWTEVLKTPGLEPADFQQALEVIDRNTRMQAKLIEDLLEMSRIISGKVRLEVRPVPITDVVGAAIDSIRAAAEAKGIHVGTECESPDATVVGDGSRLQQVVWNLLSNSIKFTPRGGHVGVAVTREESCVSVTVSDDGAGIRPEFLPHVFERFRQADASTTRQHGGLGLGLSIVKQLVELHGGEIRVDSPGEGRGTICTFTLPLVAAPEVETPLEPAAPAARAVIPPAAAFDLTGVRVLVVDDQPDSSRLVKRVLEAQHGEVHIAQSMDEALAEFGRFGPQVLLSDIGMPHHDGYELIRRIRERPDGQVVPSAALTALARGEDRDRALEAGFNTHLPKPVEPSELIRVVAELAGRSVAGERRQQPALPGV